MSARHGFAQAFARDTRSMTVNGSTGATRRRGIDPSSLQSICLLGFVAAVLVVLGGALSGAADPEGTGRLWSVPAIPVRPAGYLVPSLFVYFGGLIVMVRAWLLLRRYHLTYGLPLAAVVVVVGMWSLPFLVGPPLGSRDVYAYAAQGRLAEQGHDVYSHGPAELGEGDPLLAPVDPLYRNAPSLYGPIFVTASSIIAGVAGDHVINAVMAFRLLALAGLTLTAFAVFDLSRGLGRDPVDALILTMANPLILLHLVSGAHNEAMMLGFLLSGVALARRGRPLLGVALCVIAAAVKLPAILAVAFLGFAWVFEAAQWSRRMLRAGIVAGETVAIFGVAGWLTGWGWGWIDAMVASKPVDAYLSITRVVGGGVSLLFGMEPDRVLAAARLVGMVGAAGFTGVLLLRRYRSWPTALAWSLVVAAVLHPTTQPWYLTWGLVLLAATTAGERNRALVAACAAAVFVVLPMGPQLGLVVLDRAGPTSLIIGGLLLSLLTFSPAGNKTERRLASLDPGTVTLVVPTRHEGPNIHAFVDMIDEMSRQPSWTDADGATKDRRLHVLFVDDSDDETPDVVRKLMARRAATGEGLVDVDLLHRHPQQRWGGLGGAVVDGFALARGTIAVVMDGDLQHPASKVPELVSGLGDSVSVVVASRRVPGGSFGEGLTEFRRLLSVWSAALATLFFPSRIGPIADPLSGFFAVRLDRLDLNRLHPDGFKILIEVAATHGELVVDEVPFEFSGRVQGVSKASASEGARYLGHLVDLRVRMSRVWAGAPITQRAFGVGSGVVNRQPRPETG